MAAGATPAVHALRRHGISFTEHEYRYELKGGTAVSSRELGVDEHHVVKTLVMEDETKAPLIILMHGDREVSTKNLARQTGRKLVKPCAPEVAERHSGYQVGGTSPFGTRKPFPIYIERTILDLERIYLNGGRRGFLVGLDPREGRQGARRDPGGRRSDSVGRFVAGSVTATRCLRGLTPKTTCDRDRPRYNSRAATFAQVSLSDTVRLKTGAPGAVSRSAQK